MATVLVVEDEFGIADLIEAVLEDEGHRVLMAANGPVDWPEPTPLGISLSKARPFSRRAILTFWA